MSDMIKFLLCLLTFSFMMCSGWSQPFRPHGSNTSDTRNWDITLHPGQSKILFFQYAAPFYSGTLFVCFIPSSSQGRITVEYTSTNSSQITTPIPSLLLPGGDPIVQVTVTALPGASPGYADFSCDTNYHRHDDLGNEVSPHEDDVFVDIVAPGDVSPPSQPPGVQVTATPIGVYPTGMHLPGETVEVAIEWNLPQPANIPNDPRHTWVNPKVIISWSSELEHLYSCNYSLTQCQTSDDMPVGSSISRTRHFFRVNPQLTLSGQETATFELYDSGTNRIVKLNQDIAVGTEPRAEVSGTSCPTGPSPCVSFGRLMPGERAIATLTIVNSGSEPFDFDVSAAPPELFGASDWGSGTVQPSLQNGRHYASQTFDMVFDAPFGSQRDALCSRDASSAFYICARSITVTTTDPKLPAVAVRLIGQVHSDPVISFSGDTDENNVIDFGVVQQGATATRTLVISNTGGMNLQGYVDTQVTMTPGNFFAISSTGQDAFFLYHNDEARINLSVTPSSRGVFETGLEVHWFTAGGISMSRMFTLRVATGPSMEVLRIMPDGTRELLAYQQNIDFGSVQLAPSDSTSPAPLQQVFVIRNTTTQSSTLNGAVQIQDNSDPRTWELLLNGLPQSEPIPITIISGDEKEVSVRFIPRKVGTSTDFLHIHSNVTNQQEYFYLALRAEVDGPPPVANIALYSPLTIGRPNDIHLGGVPIGQIGVGQIKVRNAGPQNSKLHLEVSGMMNVCEAPSAPSSPPVCTNYTLSDLSTQINVHTASGTSLPLDLDSNNDDFIVLEFQPAGLGTISGTIEVLTNDPNQTSVTFNIDGEGTRFRVPPIIDLTQYPDPVIRNRAINESYHEFDLAMTQFLGTPVISNWSTYGKHASAAVGMQLYNLKVGIESLRTILAALDRNALPADLPAWAQGLSLPDRIREAVARLLALIIERDPRKARISPVKLDLITQALLVTLDTTGVPRRLVEQIAEKPFSETNINQLVSLVPRIFLARQRILDNLQLVYNELTMGNTEIYQQVTPVYVQFLTLANQSPGGNPAPLTLPLEQDPGGFLTIAFNNYAQAKILGDQARFVSDPRTLLLQRRELTHQANMFAVASEQLYVAQVHFVIMYSQVAATNGFSFYEDKCTVANNTIYRLARNWENFNSRMGFDPALAPPFPFHDLTPANFPPFLLPTDPRYAGTIVDYFTTWLNDTTCIHNSPLQPSPNPY